MSRTVFGEKLLESQRVKSVKERERFAKHLISEPQKANFQLLIVGFCRKFSTLVSECHLLADKPNRKAALSVAWMRMLGNFQAGKDTQERLIIEQFLVGQSEGQQFSPEVVHAVVSVISRTGLLHYSQSYSAEKVNLDFRTEKFTFGRGVR